MLFFKRKTQSTDNSSNKSSSVSTETIQPSKPAGGNIQVLCSAESSYCSAKFCDGVVYCHSPYSGDFIVGYYKFEDGNRCTVQCEFDKAMIGQIWPEDDNGSRFAVSLSRMGLYERAQKLGSNPPYPYPATEIIASARFSGIIENYDTYETLATFTGNPVEAAAAFVALLYEALSDTQYHAFWRE